MISKCNACNDEGTIFCPLCGKASYCSQKCRDYDWAVKHKIECKVDVQKKNIEEFEIVNQGSLGRGSFGCVKLVRDRQSGLLYAMKMVLLKYQLCNKLDKNDVSIELLKREVRIQKRLQHPHVVQLFHCFEDAQFVYLILEYAPNGSLFRYMKKRKNLPEQEAFVYFFQTCLGIDYLHKNKIIHRDLKPENLLLDNDGNIKICDFGWSAEMVQGTRTTFCGTIDYMSPEMLEDKPHDHNLDLWCLGILLYELLHGHAPFKGKNDYEKCTNIQKQQEFEIHSSEDSKSLVLSLLKRNPQERIQFPQLFKHPWMTKNAEIYGINISEYVYQPTEKYERLEQKLSSSLQMDQRQTVTTNLSVKDKESLSFSTYSAMSTYDQPQFLKRVTRRTQIQHSQDSGFFDNLLKSFGCTKRD